MMTALRQQMIDAMRQRGFSERTHRSYLAAVAALARYYRRSPSQLSVEELDAWFKYLAVERSLSGSTCRVYRGAVRFLYVQVLKWPSFDVSFVVPKRAALRASSATCSSRRCRWRQKLASASNG